MKTPKEKAIEYIQETQLYGMHMKIKPTTIIKAIEIAIKETKEQILEIIDEETEYHCEGNKCECCALADDQYIIDKATIKRIKKVK